MPSKPGTRSVETVVPVRRQGRSDRDAPAAIDTIANPRTPHAGNETDRRHGLPATIRVCLFDLDGVLTQTRRLHDTAWKQTFDGYLRERSNRTGEPFVPFDPVADYDEYVDGKPRCDGIRSFLASRSVDVTESTIRLLGDRKNALVLALIERDGLSVYDGSIRYARAVGEAGLRRGVVSSSANTAAVLAAAGIGHLFDVVVNGLVADREHLRGKPAPDTYLAAAEALDCVPAEAAVFEDALAGVEAGRAGGFGFVVGVDRVGQRDALRNHGANVVVSDLAELLT
jgi:beta-phosphoglucomutase family hydrolase